MIFIKLDREISCDYICQLAQKLVNEFHQQHGAISDCILVMDIKKPIDHSGDSPQLKIELKQ